MDPDLQSAFWPGPVGHFLIPLQACRGQVLYLQSAPPHLKPSECESFWRSSSYNDHYTLLPFIEHLLCSYQEYNYVIYLILKTSYEEGINGLILEAETILNVVKSLGRSI